MMSNDEERLVRAARGGDDRSFAVLVDQTQRSVRGFIGRYSGYWAGADDITQEAFVMAWKRLQRFDGRSSFRAWVCGIAYRLARDARRGHERALLRDGHWMSQVNMSDDARLVEDRMALRRALSELPEHQRAAVALCLGEGFSHTEAATILNMPLGTVKSNVSRGREKLLGALSEPHGVDSE